MIDVHASQERRLLIDGYLDELHRMILMLDDMADTIEGSGFALASSMVRDGLDYLNDISWLDFSVDVDNGEEEDV